MKKCILVLNIGARPYLKYTWPLIQAYGKKCAADVFAIDSILSPWYVQYYFSLFSFRSRRENIIAYFEKMFRIGVFLERYDLVMLVDDTCVISPNAPNLFDIVPKDHLAVWDEAALDLKSWHKDRRFIQRKRGVVVTRYGNTGVLVVPKCYRDLFKINSLWSARDLFVRSAYPCQAFFAWKVLLDQSVNIYDLPESFNFMYIQYHSELEAQGEKYLTQQQIYENRDKHIHHITGYFDKRESLVKEVSEVLASKSQPSA